MRAMSFVSIASVAWIVLGACASAGTSGAPGAPASQTISVIGAGGGAQISTSGENAAHVQTLPFTADQVWRALPAVFDSLGIRVQTLDGAKRTIGISGFAVRHRLKNVPLSRLIDCGTSQMGPSADDYDVRLTVFTDVHAGDGGATVTTSLEALARPINYAQEFSHCSTKGVLEQRIVDLLQARLGR